MLKNIKVKAIFNNNAKINCISKDLTNRINLVIRQEISILLIEIIEVYICFEKVIKDAKIFVKDIVIYTFILLFFDLITRYY